MTATAPDRGVASNVLDFGFVRSTGLDGAEDAFALGVAHALRLAGYDVEDDRSAGHGAVVVATPLTDAAGWLDRVEAPVILLPIVRAGDELSRWLDVAGRARSVWTGSSRHAETLRAGGVSAHHVGLACQFGQVRHHARAAHGVRDEDFVFGIHPTAAVRAADLEVLRAAVRVFFSAPATRFAKATVLVSGTRDGDLTMWRELANELRCDAVVSAARPTSGLSFAGFAALADCEIICGAEVGLVPWNAAAALFEGRTALATVGLEERPFGRDEPPHLHRIGNDSDELVAAMARLVAGAEARGGDRDERLRGAREMVATNSARAVAVAIVEALRADGMWHVEGGQ